MALLGNLAAAACLVWTLLVIPSGSAVRLFEQSLECFLVSIATLLVVPLLVIIAWRKERTYAVLLLIACLAFTPWFFSGWAMQEVAALRGIGLKP
ncbi:MAG: hypothetical protein K0Q55_97 [Verrucomicrobia bacterium]|jgi:hypothetical protein|nr:hypothetical protein [Verrucomicrobiota bacterium]